MTELIQILIQGGALGTVIALLIYMNKRDEKQALRETAYNETINEHLKRSTNVQEKSVESQIKLAEALQSLNDVVGGCPYNHKRIRNLKKS